MLRVTVEVVPHGIEEMTQQIVVVYVGNDGTGSRAVGNYDVYVEDPRGKPRPRHERAGWISKLPWVPRRGPQQNRLRLAERALAVVRDSGIVRD